MIETTLLIKIAPFHITFILIWKAPTHFEWAGGTSWSSFIVLHIFKDFICNEFDFLGNQFYKTCSLPHQYFDGWIELKDFGCSYAL